MDPEMHPSQEVRAVLDLFEGQVDLYEKETERGSQKFLKIKKMANQRYLKDELLLKEENMQKWKYRVQQFSFKGFENEDRTIFQ